MCDDVKGPQRVGAGTASWSSRRLGSPVCAIARTTNGVGGVRPDHGNRVGRDLEADRVLHRRCRPVRPCATRSPGSSERRAAAANGLDYSHFTLDQTLNMSQYNLFPNITVLVFSDMLNVVRSRPGATHLDAYMDAFTFERRPAHASARSRPFEMELDPTGDLPLGIVLNQDLANFERSQRGMHQPGLTHLSVSPTEECRIVNMHVNLEEFLGISPSELTGLTR